MIIEILAWIGALVLILQAATRIPAALTELVNACGQLLDAIGELRDRDPRGPRR
ncbi:hypothetical protein IU487_34550 [Nocardia puris]|uniref:hypothetical protein n=1 Tax=Nocardia puris TaxID=208602 RepID=UPI0018936192|nr:hypothetical protein [Nocardia puris]MBF6216120.1 hypothetical protein [Nocardia puris]